MSTKSQHSGLLGSLFKWAVPGIAVLVTARPAAGQAGGQNMIDAGAKAVVFAPGAIEKLDGFAPSFSPGGDTLYFSGDSAIYFSRRVNGQWTEPKVAGFSGHWKDMDPFVSPDGKRLFFSSYRPLSGAAPDLPQKWAHIWYVDRVSGGNWSAPRHVDAPVNLRGVDNYAPSVSSSGMLCFFSPRRDLNNKGKSYYTNWTGDHYAEPKVFSFNGTGAVRDPFISPDEHYLIFVSGSDLYVSYRVDGMWSAGQKLGAQVNDGDPKSSPYVSADGKMLYYSSAHVNGILVIPVHLPVSVN